MVVKPAGSKSWVLLYTYDGRRREMGLGRYPDVSLASARRKANELRVGIIEGVDPLTTRNSSQAPTFGEVAEKYIATHSVRWKNKKHIAQWRMTLSTYAAALSNKRVDAITVEDVLGVLRPIWKKIPETASRLRGRIEAILDAAKAEGFRQGENPAAWRGNLKHLLPGRTVLSRGHHKAMYFEEVPAFVSELRTKRSVDRLALEFIILTAARSGEVFGATWEEVNTKARVWTVPATRMKSGRTHRVPLSERAVEILDTMHEFRASDAQDAFIFPGAQANRPLSSMATAMLLRRMGRQDATTHGFRSSFRDWAGEVSSFEREVVEVALAHTVGDATERAYRRGDAFEKRRRLMEDWAGYIETSSVDATGVSRAA
jgi:integrase